MEITREDVEAKILGDNHSVVKRMQQQLPPLRAWLEKPEVGMKAKEEKKGGGISEVTVLLTVKKLQKFFLQNSAVSGF